MYAYATLHTHTAYTYTTITYIYIYTYTYIERYKLHQTTVRSTSHPRSVCCINRGRRCGVRVGLYKIWFCFWAFSHESIPFFAHPPFLYPPPHVIAHTIAQYNTSPRLPVIAIYTTMLVMAYRVTTNFLGGTYIIAMAGLPASAEGLRKLSAQDVKGTFQKGPNAGGGTQRPDGRQGTRTRRDRGSYSTDPGG